MAISLISSPSTWARVNDTNRMVYKFASTNSGATNFQYQFNMKAYFPDNFGSPYDLGTFNIHPMSDGTCEFNPSTIYKNYMTYDINVGTTSYTELLRTALKYQLYCYEFYGTPPTKKTAGSWYEATPLNVYNGAQMSIPYDYLALNTKGNLKWVMDGNVANRGQYLTDSLEQRMDNTGHFSLYALFPQAGRPTRVRYTIKYWGYTGGEIDSPNIFNPNVVSNQQSETSSSPTRGLNDPQIQNPIGGYSWLTATNYENIPANGFTYANSLGFFYQCGPYQAINQSTILAPYKDTWSYYDVDLMSGNTVMNTQPMRFINTKVCTKYGEAWQLFWLNPHGGFDTFMFDKKRDVNFKIKRDTYKVKLPSDFSPYDAGERIFNVDVQEEITLRTRLLSQKESQMLTQLVQSPVVFAKQNFDYGGGVYTYAVPYIVVNDTFKYEQKVNDKEIVMEVTIRPAVDKVIQRN